MKTRYSRFDDGFLKLVDEAAEFVKQNGYKDFVLSLVAGKEYTCHNGDTIDHCTDNIITKLSAAGVIYHFLGGGFKLAMIGEVVQRVLREKK
jgi:hypothetical protein